MRGNFLTYILDYIILQIRKVNSEKDYYMRTMIRSISSYLLPDVESDNGNISNNKLLILVIKFALSVIAKISKKMSKIVL